ncbi:acetylxylan esterase [Streptomyces sp. URMC 125]|uniref:acetylxylan esterase n=1 Tax=Streptomyces sp. URMC 125 TaxID=3423419 RepID=UPI003F19E62A
MVLSTGGPAGEPELIGRTRAGPEGVDAKPVHCCNAPGGRPSRWWGRRRPVGRGFMTRGIDAPRRHGYRRPMTDCVRAVEAARGLPWVDPGRIAVAGAARAAVPPWPWPGSCRP